MNSLMQVQQDMLGRMEQIKSLSEGAAIKPAQLFEAQPAAGFGRRRRWTVGRVMTCSGR
jgi:flagellar hook-basal body complex protein FliE